jgi:hypothetical protein
MCSFCCEVSNSIRVRGRGPFLHFKTLFPACLYTSRLVFCCKVFCLVATIRQ